MASVIIMPRQGQSVESCIITKWHKQKGERVSAGDVLFSYETDKAAFDEEAKTDGVLLEIFFEEGDDVPCLTNVCVIGEVGEDISAFRPEGVSEAETALPLPQANAVTETESVHESATPLIAEGGRLKISPRARALSERSGADVSFAEPTGANGRIMERDIEKVIAEGRIATNAAQGHGAGVLGTGIGGRVTTADLKAANTEPVQTAQAPENEFELVPLSGIRKVIAKTMHTSLMNAAQLTLNSSFDATDIIEFRKRVKESAKIELPPISPTDIIVYMTARLLIKHKSLNAHFLEDKMHIYNAAHIGVATDTPRGLMVPTVFNADSMTLAGVSAKIKELAGLCRQGSISPDLLSGGTFTVSNLGAMGIESFTPVLNPPQTGLLGVCSITERTKNGRFYPAMGLSLTFDHRALDGADAARFLKELVESLESFSLIAAIN